MLDVMRRNRSFLLQNTDRMSAGRGEESTGNPVGKKTLDAHLITQSISTSTHRSLTQPPTSLLPTTPYLPSTSLQSCVPSYELEEILRICIKCLNKQCNLFRSNNPTVPPPVCHFQHFLPVTNLKFAYGGRRVENKFVKMPPHQPHPPHHFYSDSTTASPPFPTHPSSR
ncbi:unnamed protein product [Lota lota]